MSLTQALNTASSGLKVTQSAMSIVASNVANAQTPGYVRKTLQLTTSAAGDGANSVQVAGIHRELDQYLQGVPPGNAPARFPKRQDLRFAAAPQGPVQKGQGQKTKAWGSPVSLSTHVKKLPTISSYPSPSSK